MTGEDLLVEALLTSPAGAVTIAALEWGALGADDLEQIGVERGQADPGAVGAAVRDVHAARFEDPTEVATFAAMRLAGSHWTESPAHVARALHAAPARRPLAEAIVDEFSHRLESVVHRPKHHRLRSTGETVVDPGYLSTWTVRAPSS